jgi:hypothetical protein
MKTTDVRRIKKAIQEQAMKGSIAVNANGHRIVSVKKVEGVLMVRGFGRKWEQAEFVSID